MCDTMVALPHVTKDHSLIFAKNSDRQPNEPLLLVHIPQKKHPANSKVTCTYIEVDQVTETNALFLYKPSWMWGGEMGTNEHGLTIGNEAVFTKSKVSDSGLLGMDLIRLALERCATSEEAIVCITDLIDRYRQGGNCGYEKPFTYHNAFLIADYHSAWKLETAHFMWVAKKIDDYAAISNRLSIGSDYDLAHPDVVSYATERGWHKKGEPFHFANSYSDRLFTTFSGSKQRQQCANDMLQQRAGQITIETMMDILASHEYDTELPPINRFSINSVCMHAGFFYGDHATGSYIVSLKKDEPLVGFVTGSSTPCISLFKPLPLFTEPLQFIWEEDDEQALHFWLRRERLHRQLMNVPDEILFKYSRDRKLVQRDIMMYYLQEQYEAAWERELEFVEEIENSITNYEMGVNKGNFYFKHYWRKQNKQLMTRHATYFHSIT